MPVMNVKCVLVGDCCVGKTSLLAVYTMCEFSEEYVPTVFDNFTKNVKLGRRLVNVALWDTSGLNGYDRMRPLSYTETDVFVVCFSLTNQESYERVCSKWVPEIRHHCPDCPIVLVGTKSDLRGKAQPTLSKDGDSKFSGISTDEGKRLSKLIKANSYMECSAHSQTEVENVFEKAIRIGVSSIRKRSRRLCQLL